MILILIAQEDSYVLSCWDLVLGWECAVTNEFVPFLHCVCQADKNIPCQLAAWRGGDSVQMRQTPLTVFSSSRRALSVSLRALLLLFSVLASWFKADIPSLRPHTHARALTTHYPLNLWIPVWNLYVSLCAHASRQLYIAMATVWRKSERIR